MHHPAVEVVSSPCRPAPKSGQSRAMSKDAPRTPAGSPPKSKLPERRNKAHSNPILKVLAENLFVLSDQGITHADIAQMPEFEGIDVNQIRQWSHYGEWNKKRREHLGRLQKTIMDHLGGMIMQQRKKQLQQYDRLHDQLAAYVLPDESGHVTLAPRTAEGAINAMLKVEAAAARMRQQMAESIGGSVVTGGQPQAPAPSEMSQEDAQHLAHLLLAKQAGLALPVSDPPPADKEPPAVVDAEPEPEPAAPQSQDDEPV